jgi:hypothetical protein
MPLICVRNWRFAKVMTVLAGIITQISFHSSHAHFLDSRRRGTSDPSFLVTYCSYAMVMQERHDRHRFSKYMSYHNLQHWCIPLKIIIDKVIHITSVTAIWKRIVHRPSGCSYVSAMKGISSCGPSCGLPIPLWDTVGKVVRIGAGHSFCRGRLGHLIESELSLLAQWRQSRDGRRGSHGVQGR